jgi:hypothetical protein
MSTIKQKQINTAFTYSVKLTRDPSMNDGKQSIPALLFRSICTKSEIQSSRVAKGNLLQAGDQTPRKPNATQRTNPNR